MQSAVWSPIHQAEGQRKATACASGKQENRAAETRRGCTARSQTGFNPSTVPKYEEEARISPEKSLYGGSTPAPISMYNGKNAYAPFR